MGQADCLYSNWKQINPSLQVSQTINVVSIRLRFYKENSDTEIFPLQCIVATLLHELGFQKKKTS